MKNALHSVEARGTHNRPESRVYFPIYVYAWGTVLYIRPWALPLVSAIDYTLGRAAITTGHRGPNLSPDITR